MNTLHSCGNNRNADPENVVSNSCLRDSSFTVPGLEVSVPYVKRDKAQALRRLRARAYERYLRRVRRSQLIWSHFRSYYNKSLHLSSQLTIYDEWMGQRVKWAYERSLHLEDQAFMLHNRLAHYTRRSTLSRRAT